MYSIFSGIECLEEYFEEEASDEIMEWEAREYGFDSLEDYLETNIY